MIGNRFNCSLMCELTQRKNSLFLKYYRPISIINTVVDEFVRRNTLLNAAKQYCEQYRHMRLINCMSQDDVCSGSTPIQLLCTGLSLTTGRKTCLSRRFYLFLTTALLLWWWDLLSLSHHFALLGVLFSKSCSLSYCGRYYMSTLSLVFLVFSSQGQYGSCLLCNLYHKKRGNGHTKVQFISI